MSFKFEVHGCGDPPGRFTSSAVRLETKVETEAYGRELGSRWFGFDDSRVAESDDPVNYMFDIERNKLQTIATVPDV